jgi:hypothetical protein
VNTPKAKLKAACIEMLAELAPEPELIRLFKAAVLGAYGARQADARRQVVETERQLVCSSEGWSRLPARRKGW